MYSILVTGGAGFIGSHLVDELVKRGHRVRILDSLVDQVHHGKRPDYINPEAEFIKGDMCDAEIVGKALEGIEVVYHEASEVGVGQSMYEIVRYVKANDLGTAVLLEEMLKKRDQFKKLMVASSMSIYGEGAYISEKTGNMVFPQVRPTAQLLKRDWELKDVDGETDLIPTFTPEHKTLIPTSVYAANKQVQEQYCLVVGRAYTIPTVALRYFNAYGTRQALSNPYTGVCAIFSSRLMNNEAPMVFEDGKQSRDFVHVSDIVQANILALESDKANYETFNVGTGKPLSVVDVSNLIAKGLGKNLEPQVVGKYREGDIRHCVADISKAKELLGYEPKVSLEGGMQELLAWVSEQQATDMVTQATSELSARNLVR
jgi:dTDP-L-rhamnose 4-epimerase